MNTGFRLTLALAFGALPASAAAIAWARPRVRREMDVKACPGCGYSLRGLESMANCPECGASRAAMARMPRPRYPAAADATAPSLDR